MLPAEGVKREKGNISDQKDLKLDIDKLRGEIMNIYLINILTEKIVATLPKEQREIYNYVIKMEDQMAEESVTKEEFMVRLKSESPHERAARHFNMTFYDLLQTVDQIDREIANQLDTKIKSVSWKDYTELARMQMRVPFDQKIFLLTFPR
ncbi:hypothetical protein [Halobacillus massiliensis]|uniref:hypothetical protein n=1 Tax=Halobacillus massiliensis TaxID=1926286 RepID=UPI0009E26A2B|nr:hypothetical protein [Halobacillus massiliensis]